MSNTKSQKHRSAPRLGSVAAVAVAAGSLLALPATAGAHLTTTVETVKAHTSAADAGLDRAVALYGRDRDRTAARAFDRSRRQMGKATAEAAKLRRSAEGESDRADAARARRIVASQQDANVEQLVGLLDEASGRVENRIAKAALTDTRGRDKAIAILTALADQVPAQAQNGIAKAIAALSQNRTSEVRGEARALAGDDVSTRNKRRVAKSVEHNLDGQQRAAETLAQLIAREDMPASSKAGLQRAYDNVTSEQKRSAKVLSRFSDRMPASIRSFVTAVVQQAQENAREMRENRPTPPSRQPQDAGQPDQAPAGQPDEAPAGRPEGAPAP